jgi:RNA polymerase-binding transcription factor DksA
MTSAVKSVALRQAELEARRAELQGRIDTIKAELDSHQDRDWEELATQREGDEVLEGMGNDAQAELRAIAAALKRVETGDYGTCQRCGNDISEARLNVLPYTPFCKECAA